MQSDCSRLPHSSAHEDVRKTLTVAPEYNIRVNSTSIKSLIYWPTSYLLTKMYVKHWIQLHLNIISRIKVASSASYIFTSINLNHDHSIIIRALLKYYILVIRYLDSPFFKKNHSILAPNIMSLLSSPCNQYCSQIENTASYLLWGLCVVMCI